MTAPADVISAFAQALQNVDGLRSVGTVVDLAALDKAPPLHQRPAAWVLTEQEAGIGERFTAAPGQQLDVSVAVLVCTGAPGRAAGADQPWDLMTLLAKVRNAVLGISALHPLPRFQRGAILQVSAGEIWWRDNWTARAALAEGANP